MVVNEAKRQARREQFRNEGQTIRSWAAAHGFPHNKVYAVLNGQIKAHRGLGHDIAKALGIK